jgi:EAL domain-containing protein (putative c-di-GMP-specific phosphodiesterase class I)
MINQLNNRYLSSQVNEFTLYGETIKQELLKILLTNNLTTHYQPIVSFHTGLECGYEALTRGPVLTSFHKPNKLFYHAEIEGLLYPLEKLAHELAVKHSKAFIQKNQKLFLNLNPKVIYDLSFTPKYTISLLEQYHLKPSNIVFEITERTVIDDFTAFKKALHPYRNQGFQIAIDDAGTGYSSLQSICELNPDFIKVDRSLIKNIHEYKIKENMLEAIVTFAKKMNSKVIAEGIETLEELQKVIDLNIEFGQGFLLARPSYPVQPISENVKLNIMKSNNKNRQKETIEHSIKSLVSLIPTIAESNCDTQLTECFNEHQDAHYVVIMNEDTPIKMISRERWNFYQQSHHYFNKEIFPLFVHKLPLIIHSQFSIEDAGKAFVSQKDHEIFQEFILVMEDNKLLGAVYVKSLFAYLFNKLSCENKKDYQS